MNKQEQKENEENENIDKHIKAAERSTKNLMRMISRKENLLTPLEIVAIILPISLLLCTIKRTWIQTATSSLRLIS